MIFRKLTTHIRIVAFTVLLLQASGLAICQDSHCLEGDSEEICQTALCGLLNSEERSGQPAQADQEESCQCACYLSYDVPEVNSISTTISDSYFFTETQNPETSPVNRIDHIPRS